MSEPIAHRSMLIAPQYTGTLASTLRDHASMPPRMDCAFSNPCCRSHAVTFIERTVMAHDHDVILRIEFLMRTRRHIAHRDELRAGDLRRFKFPGFADIDQRECLACIKLPFDFFSG